MSEPTREITVSFLDARAYISAKLEGLLPDDVIARYECDRAAIARLYRREYISFDQAEAARKRLVSLLDVEIRDEAAKTTPLT